MAGDLHIVTVYSTAGQPLYVDAANDRDGAKAIATARGPGGPATHRRHGAAYAKVRVWHREGPRAIDPWRELPGYAL